MEQAKLKLYNDLQLNYGTYKNVIFHLKKKHDNKYNENENCMSLLYCVPLNLNSVISTAQ